MTIDKDHILLYSTPVSSDDRRDWIAEYEARLKQSYTSSKPSTSRLIYQDILQILKRLDI